MCMYQLLTPQHANPKLQKTRGNNYVVGLHLAPSKSSGHNVCPSASGGCIKSCLNFSGRGRCTQVQTARIRRTKLLFENMGEFRRQLFSDLNKLIKYCAKRGLNPVCRLNLTSDVAWELIMPEIFTTFPQIQFYDYTKIVERTESKLPKNYHLTFSKSESNAAEMLRVLNTPTNIAVVFKSLPKRYLGRKVIVGDDTDLRFLDGKNKIIGLTAKGRAKYDVSGFVVCV